MIRSVHVNLNTNNCLFLQNEVAIKSILFIIILLKMKPSRNSFANPILDDTQNEIMDSEYNQSRLTNSNSLNKDQIIRKLSLKNDKLKQEVEKVKRVLTDDDKSKTRYGINLPDFRQEVSNKELQNAYKLIKHYEHQINKRKKVQEDGTFIQQTRKLQQTLKEKEQITAKLKLQLFEINKNSKQMVKMLKNDKLKTDYETKAQKLHSEIKFLRQKIVQQQNKIAISNNNRNKQRAFIEKLERLMTQQQGGAMILQSLRSKIQSPNRKSPSYTSYESEFQPNETTVNNNQEVIEDRTIEAYQTYLNEIKLLKKVQKDQQNKIKQMEKEREQAAERNFRSRNQLLQVQHNIEVLERQIQDLKQKIDPRNLIPQRGKQLLKPPSNRYEVKKSPESKARNINHLFKNEQLGAVTLSGKRFTDRVGLGKNKTFIVGIIIYEKETQEHELIGFQVTYSTGGALKKGLLNLLQRKKIPSNPKVFRLESGDHFKTLQCVFSNDDEIIIGMSMVSANGVVAKGGCFAGSRRSLPIAPKQYPACLFGSLNAQGVEMLGSQILQE